MYVCISILFSFLPFALFSFLPFAVFSFSYFFLFIPFLSFSLLFFSICLYVLQKKSSKRTSKMAKDNVIKTTVSGSPQGAAQLASAMI
jgi:type III secretory pathway component EscU